MNSLLYSLYNLYIWPHPLPWPSIFKIKFWNSCGSGADGSDSFEFINKKAENNGVEKNKNMHEYIFLQSGGSWDYFVFSLV